MFILYSIHAKDFILGKTLTQDRRHVAKKLADTLITLTDEINSANTVEKLASVNERINALLTLAQKQNMELNTNHGFKTTHGNLAQRMSFFQTQLNQVNERVASAKQAKEQKPEVSDEEILLPNNDLKGLNKK
jgi:hypothetical protein